MSSHISSLEEESDSSPVRYATAGRIGRRRGGERRCLSKRQALEPSMLRRGGLRETTRDRRTGVSFNVDETPIGVADGSKSSPRFPVAVKIVRGVNHSYREVLFRASVHLCVCTCVRMCTCAPYTHPCLFDVCERVRVRAHRVSVGEHHRSVCA